MKAAVRLGLIGYGAIGRRLAELLAPFGMRVLGFRRADGTYIALLANYAMHNVALGGENRAVSADMAGVAAAFLRSRLPGEPVVLMSPSDQPALRGAGDPAGAVARSVVDVHAPAPARRRASMFFLTHGHRRAVSACPGWPFSM